MHTEVLTAQFIERSELRRKEKVMKRRTLQLFEKGQERKSGRKTGTPDFVTRVSKRNCRKGCKQRDKSDYIEKLTH